MSTLSVRKNFIGALIGINLVALPAIFFLNNKHILDFQGPSSKSTLPAHAQIPAFELTERSGKIVTDAQMRGRVWVADFIFTRCSNQCPMMSAKLSLLQQSLPGFVSFVSFSVDPLHDTPEQLRIYAQNYRADENRWLFLTGQKETVDRILSTLHLGNGSDPNLHSLRFVLMDEKLQVRGYYNSEDPQALEQLKRDVRRLTENHV